MSSEIKCPKCGSNQISANKRGYSFWTGFIGSGKIIITCLNCGNTFRPGDQLSDQEKIDLKKRKLEDLKKEASDNREEAIKANEKFAEQPIAARLIVAIIVVVLIISFFKNCS